MATWEREELSRSRDRGIWDRWGVQDHEIGEEWVSFDFDQARIYAPLEHPELAHQFADVARDVRALRAFLSTYGRLGWYELIGDEPASSGWLKQRRREYHKSLSNGGPVYAEPIDWIRIHAVTVDWCLRAGRALKMDEQGCEKLAATLPEPYGIRGTIGSVSPIRQATRDTVSVRDFVGGVLEDILWVNLRGVRRRVAYRAGALRTMWGGSSLLESIYTLVVDGAIGGRLALCQAEDCGAVFIQTDDRQRFCPPRKGQQKSACMNRLRIRRRRAEQRKERAS